MNTRLIGRWPIKWISSSRQICGSLRVVDSIWFYTLGSIKSEGKHPGIWRASNFCVSLSQWSWAWYVVTFMQGWGWGARDARALLTTLESQIKVPLVIKVPKPRIWIAVLFWYPNSILFHWLAKLAGWLGEPWTYDAAAALFPSFFLLWGKIIAGKCKDILYMTKYG